MTKSATAEKLDTFVPSKLQTSLNTALSHIGHRNGHSLPEGASATLHELYVARQAVKFFAPTEKMLLDTLKDMHEDVLEGIDGGESFTLESDGVYELVVTTKQPSSRLDAKTFTNELRKLGVDAGIIEKARKAATKPTAVPKSFEVRFVNRTPSS